MNKTKEITVTNTKNPPTALTGQIVKSNRGKAKKYTVEGFKGLIEQYLAYVGEQSKVPTITGFCVFADCSNDLVQDYRHATNYSALVKKLDIVCENALVDKVINDNKPVGGIFLLKAKYGYQEAATRHDITINQGVVQLPNRS